MPIAKDKVTRWILDAIASDLPFKYWEEWMFNPWYKKQCKELLPQGVSRALFKRVYLSPNRPVAHAWARQLDDCLIVDDPTGRMSYVASREPLAPEILYELELYPLLNARGDALAAMLDASDFPFSMGRVNSDGSVGIAVAGIDPRDPTGWRVTFFDENAGPTGHFEVPDAPSAIKEMINRKYMQIVSPSLLDEIATTFPIQEKS